MHVPLNTGAEHFMQGDISIRLSGEIDHHCAENLRKKLDRLIDDKKPARLVLDFSAVTMMDSSGIGLIIGRYKRIRSRGGNIVITGVNRHVDLLLKMSGIYQLINKAN